MKDTVKESDHDGQQFLKAMNYRAGYLVVLPSHTYLKIVVNDTVQY